jgi:hypothetical protein
VPAPSKKPAPVVEQCAWIVDVPPQGNSETIDIGVTETTTKSVVADTQYSYTCPAGVTYSCVPNLNNYFPNHGNTVCTGNKGGVITWSTTRAAEGVLVRALTVASDTASSDAASSVAPSLVTYGLVAAVSLFGVAAATGAHLELDIIRCAR